MTRHNPQPDSQRGRAVVIGGGVVGAACAYYLSQAGWQVELLEKGAFGKACSHGNCGFVCPSHVLPLTAPGMVAKTLKTMFQNESPFYIKPRLDVGLARWFWAFSRCCNEGHMFRAAKAKQALLNSSMALYEQLQADGRLPCEWQRRGLLFVYRSKREWEHYHKTNDLLRERFGLSATPYNSEQLEELEPALKPGLGGGWHYETDTHLRPDKLLASWRRLLEDGGVAIRENCPAGAFCLEPNPKPHRAAAVEVSHNTIQADTFIVAAGAWTPEWKKQLGGRLPIQPGKGYSITMSRPAVCPRIPLMFEEHKVAVTPMESGYRLGSTMEFSGYDSSLNRRRLNYLKQTAEIYLRHPYVEPAEEEWCGWRPMTSDDLPLIGRSQRLENVYIASGHGMLGVSMAPATGKLIAELLTGATPHIDPAPYSPSRFC